MKADSGTPPERVFHGIGITAGVAIAPVFHVLATPASVRETGSAGEEQAALEKAMGDASRALARLVSELDGEAAEILEFQLVLLEDEEMLAPALSAIAAGTAAHVAWRDLMDAEIAHYREGDDPVFTARAGDLADLRDRVASCLQGSNAVQGPVSASIVVARDLAPSLLLEFDAGQVAGIALGEGSRTSHVALLARARGIPMVAGLGDVNSTTCTDEAVLDVQCGCLTLQPSATTLERARRDAARFATAGARSGVYLDRIIHDRDGQRVKVCVNIDHVSMLDAVEPRHCDGIGLARTEFLFEGGVADEDSQLAVYGKLLTWAQGRPVTVRTLDAGGDKPLPGLRQPSESNPFLGLRGVRLALARPEIFETQLRALLRAAALGPLKIMIPMVTEPAEMSAVRALVQRCVAQLTARGADFARAPLGMMVEVPAAALSAAHFDADFYSIGSNDLIQYATACARDNAEVAALARGDHPGVTALLEAVVAAGRQCAREVSLCGDLASDPGDAIRLLRLGIRTLSVAPATLGPVKAALARSAGRIGELARRWDGRQPDHPLERTKGKT